MNILTRLGMVDRIPQPNVIANVTASSSILNGEVGRKIIDIVANAPPPSKSNLILDTERTNNNNSNNNMGMGMLMPVTPMLGSVTDSVPQEFSTSEIYAQRLQSFYPSCGIPNFTDPSVWKQPNQREMRLYFDDLSIITPKMTSSLQSKSTNNNDNNGATRRMTQVTILWAKLRLYIFAGPECVNGSAGNTGTDDNNDKSNKT